MAESRSSDENELNFEKQAFASVRTSRGVYDEQWQTYAQSSSIQEPNLR